MHFVYLFKSTGMFICAKQEKILKPGNLVHRPFWQKCKHLDQNKGLIKRRYIILHMHKIKSVLCIHWKASPRQLLRTGIFFVFSCLQELCKTSSSRNGYTNIPWSLLHVTWYFKEDNTSTNTMLMEPTLSSDFLNLEDQFNHDHVTKAGGHPVKDDLRLLEVGVTAFPKASRGVPPVVSRLFDSRQTVDDVG